jgi:hypothetical protein
MMATERANKPPGNRVSVKNVDASSLTCYAWEIC